MKEYISKSALVAEIDRQKIGYNVDGKHSVEYDITRKIIDIIDTLEVKEVDIASMADEYYDALIKEAEMDVDMAGHCRLAYYNGCKDVLNKIRKGE